MSISDLSNDASGPGEGRLPDHGAQLEREPREWCECVELFLRYKQNNLRWGNWVDLRGRRFGQGELVIRLRVVDIHCVVDIHWVHNVDFFVLRECQQ